MSDQDNEDQRRASISRIAEAVAQLNAENETVRGPIRRIVIEEQTALWGYDFSKEENRLEARAIYEEARSRRRKTGLVWEKILWPLLGAIATALLAFAAAHINVGLK